MLFRTVFALIFALGLVACDGEEPADGGPGDAATGTDAGPTFVCERTIPLEGVLDEQVEVTFDTEMTDLAPQDLGLQCGNTDAETRWAPQQVVAYTVPGTEPVSLEFTTINPETTADMVVFVQARINDCGEIRAGRFPPYCWGPVAPSPPAMPENAEWRATGQLQANGGDTVFFFVTGFSEISSQRPELTDRGTVRLQVTARPNEVPTLTSALVVLDGEDVRVEATGSDPNANVRGALLNFYDDSGELLDIYGDGAASVENSVFEVRFDDPVSTGFDWSGGAWVRSVPGMGTQLGEYLVANEIPTAMVRAYDAPNGVSEGMMVPIQTASIVGFGEACDAVTLCRPEMVCDPMSMTCGPSMAVSDRCTSAPDVGLPAFVDTAVSATVSGNVRGEPAHFEPAEGCVDPGAAGGGEVVYTLDAFAPFDLLVSTAQPGTGATDTVVYVRRGCFDRGSELGCNNDGGGGVASELEIRDLEAGGYFIYVEELRQMDPPGTGAFELQVTARPVLPMGATCDMAEVDNRCANGPCASGVCP